MSQDDALTSTPERRLKADCQFEGRQMGRNVARAADRIVPVFEFMRRRGQITQEEASAGVTYAGYWHGARRVPGLVSAYGQQRWSGTTAGQSDTASLLTEEWPIYCAQKLHDAKAAIGDKALTDVLDRVIEQDATLESVGREFLGSKSPPQAMSAGAAIVKVALRRLAIHYGYIRDHDP